MSAQRTLTKTIVRRVAAAMEGGSTRALTIVSTILTDTRAGAMRPVRVMTPSGTTDATRAIAAAHARSSRIARIWIRAPIAGKAIAGRGLEARQVKHRGRDPSRSGVAAPAIASVDRRTTIKTPLLARLLACLFAAAFDLQPARAEIDAHAFRPMAVPIDLIAQHGDGNRQPEIEHVRTGHGGFPSDAIACTYLQREG